MKPKIAILVTDGTNCDEELFYAFEKFGSDPENVHVNELRDKSQNLKNYQILALPGGFAYGDDVASGKILAVEIISFVKIKIEKSQAKFLDPFVGKTLDIAVNHGEGRFFAQPQNLAKIEKQALVFCRYVDEGNKKTQKYPNNPNGSINAIAGVCDQTGRILGL